MLFLKKKVISAQKQYDGAKKAFEELKQTQVAERDAILAQLKEIEKELDASILARYQTKRKEIEFPFVGEAMGTSCPFCGSGFSIMHQGNLSKGVDCETCKKIIFGN